MIPPISSWCLKKQQGSTGTLDDGCEAALVGFLFSIAFEYVHRFVMLGHAAVPQMGRIESIGCHAFLRTMDPEKVTH